MQARRITAATDLSGERDEANLECMSAPRGSRDWNCGAGFAQRLNGTLTIAASLLVIEKNMSHILGTFSLAVHMDNV